MDKVNWSDVINESINDPQLMQSPFVCDMTEDILILLDKLDAYRINPTDVRLHRLNDWMTAIRDKYAYAQVQVKANSGASVSLPEQSNYVPHYGYSW